MEIVVILEVVEVVEVVEDDVLLLLSLGCLGTILELESSL